MDYVRVGTSGLKVSRICLGMMTYGTPKWRDWVLDEEDSRPFVKRALELGINFFDTADMYSTGVSEEVTGRALRDFARREEVVLATKVYFPTNPEDPNARGNSRKHIMDAIDASLRRLGTDYVDLYQIHRWDYSTPIEETMEALHDVVKTGKARYIGASSMYAWQFSKTLHVAAQNRWTRFISMQNHLNLIYREEEREMLPLCIDQGIGVLPWSPLARGFLTRPRQRNEAFPTTRSKSDTMSKEMYYRPEDYDVLERLVSLAEQRGVTPAQIALAWLLQKPGVAAPIIGASKMSHLEDAVASIKVELSESEVAQLEEPYRPHPVLGHS
jgi:aryl-alcohol dehydrogenase (NADP+)